MIFRSTQEGVHYGKYIAFNHNNGAVYSALWHLSARDASILEGILREEEKGGRPFSEKDP